MEWSVKDGLLFHDDGFTHWALKGYDRNGQVIWAEPNQEHTRRLLLTGATVFILVLEDPSNHLGIIDLRGQPRMLRIGRSIRQIRNLPIPSALRDLLLDRIFGIVRSPKMVERTGNGHGTAGD